MVVRGGAEAPRWNPESLLTLLAKTALWGSALSGLYLLHGALFGGLGDLTQRLPPADQERILSNVRLFSRLFLGLGMVAGALLGTRLYRDAGFLGAAVAAGLALGVGVPTVLVPSELSPLADSETVRGVGPALSHIVFAFRHLGLFLLIEGLGLTALHQYLKLRESLMRPRVAKHLDVSTSPALVRGIYTRCWESPHRRAALCRTCPTYEARTPCWKLKSGCYCNAVLVQQAVQVREQGPSAKLSLNAPTKQVRQLVDCGECPIYLYHQRQKYRVAVPVVALLGIAALFFILPLLNGAYDALITSVDRVAAHLSYMGEATRARGPNTLSALDHLGLRYLLGLSFSALFVAYLLQGVDYVIFKLKL